MALAVIVLLYITIGLMSAAGTVAIVRRFLPARVEQVFFGVFLVLIAAFYLAFAAYFNNPNTWPMELAAFAVFALFGLAGCRTAALLILGYLLHGIWDLLHELPVYTDFQLGADRLTEIPMTYGVFCVTYDWCMAAYFYSARSTWRAGNST